MEKKHKILIFAVMFIIAATIAGYNIEKRENTEYTIETVSDEEAAKYDYGEDIIIGGRININTADALLLEKLDGIGGAIAERIVEYRNENGFFKNIEELKNVAGIGKGKFEAIKDKICCGDGTEMENVQ